MKKLILVILLCLCPVAFAQELVTNGGFETGDFTGWTPAGAGLTVGNAQPAFGTFNADVAANGVAKTLTQTLSTVVGQTYAISFFLRNGTSDASRAFAATWGGTPFVSLAPGAAPVTGGGPNNYLQFTSLQVATSTSTVLGFGFINNASTWRFDQVSVTAAPELDRSQAVVALTSLLTVLLVVLERRRRPTTGPGGTALA